MLFTRKNPAELQQQLNSLKGGYQNNDEKVWKPTKDANGNGTAVIRFLPAVDENSLPFVRLINHFFKKNGKTYAANCTSTHDDYDSCPVCQYLKENNLYETNKKEYDLVKRKTQYWANILVLKDPGNPANENKVFKYRFGVKVMEKIQAQSAGNPDVGIAPVDVTCVFGGANLYLKVKQVGGFDNYDDSTFMTPSEIANINSPEVQKHIAEGVSPIGEYVAKDKFESYEKNKEKFDKVMGTAVLGGAAASAAAQADKLDQDLNAFNTEMDSYVNSAPAAPVPDLNSVGSTSTGTSNQELEELMAELMP